MQTQLPGGLFESLPVFRITGEGWKHPAVALDRPVCVIGRQERANLPLQEAHVSKLHAFVVRDQGRVYLRDLASTNGVQLNGAPVEEVGLSDEDVLRIGTFTLRCASGFSGHVDDPRREELPAMQNGAASSAAAAEFRWDDEQFTFPPGRHTVLIGRRPQCDLRLDHPSVAPVHAILFEIEGERFVQDLATPSGTTLNGRRVHRAPLNDGDELRVGTLTLRYVLAQEREAPEAALEGEMVDSIFGANAANEDDIVEAEDDSGSGIASTVMRDDEEPIQETESKEADELIEPVVNAEGYGADESIELDVTPQAADAAEVGEDEIEIEEIDIEPSADESAEDAEVEQPIPDEPEMELKLKSPPEETESDEAQDLDEAPPLELTPFEPPADEAHDAEDDAAEPEQGPLQLAVGPAPVEHAADDASTGDNQGEEVQSKPTVEKVSELVEEVAEKAEDLKEAWTELRFEEDDDQSPRSVE